MLAGDGGVFVEGLSWFRISALKGWLEGIGMVRGMVGGHGSCG